MLVMIMCISLVSCGGGEKRISVGDVKFSVLGCNFESKVYTGDEEAAGMVFQEIKDKVYVDLRLKVENKGDTPLTEEDFSGYFTFEDFRYDLQYEVEYAVDATSDEIPAKSTGIIHLLNRVDKAAEKNELTVTYFVCGKEFNVKVDPSDTRTALEKKAEVVVGKKYSANGMYDFKVISCERKQYVQATKYSESEQYEAMGNYDIIDLLLKVKNKTDVNLGKITGYAPVNERFTWADVKMEVENNTKLKDLDDNEKNVNAVALQPGQEEYIHICAKVKKNEKVDGSAIRFNLGGNYYYCKLAE